MEENRKWQAKWIWLQPEENLSACYNQSRVYFRREFNVPHGENAQLIIDVSADSRYQLFLNGQSILRGPCKGDEWSHYYETVSLTELLIPGKNLLSAVVVHYPVHLPGNDHLFTAGYSFIDSYFYSRLNPDLHSGLERIPIQSKIYREGCFIYWRS